MTSEMPNVARIVVSGSRPTSGRSAVICSAAPSTASVTTDTTSAIQKLPVVMNAVVPTYAPSMNRSPCAKFTMSMIPKISVRPEATSARIMPFTRPLTICTRTWSTGIMRSDSEILVDDAGVGAQRRGRRVVADHALLHDVDAVGDAERERHVLLDEQDRDAVLVQHLNDVADLRDHARHQPLGRLVEQDDARLEHHRPRDGEHLLLAARERAARLVAT